jgi:hypothetical protein
VVDGGTSSPPGVRGTWVDEPGEERLGFMAVAQKQGHVVSLQGLALGLAGGGGGWGV